MAEVLVIAAHMDDEVLGCGGTIAKHTSQGDQVALCVITDSSTTQYKDQPEKIEQKKKEGLEASAYLGITKTFHLDFPDMQLDSVPHHQVNDALSKVVHEVAPEVVYIHFWGDLNLDHVIAFRSTMVALRPLQQRCRAIYAYEVLSSTEWALPNTPFQPNRYVDIGTFLDTKLRAMAIYQTEVREYPHPRSLQSIEYLARKRGAEVSLTAAEAFITVRSIWSP